MAYKSSYTQLVKMSADHEARAGRLRAVQQEADPELAGRVGRLYRHYPWVQPGVLLSLARFGAEPSSETAQLASVLDARRRDLSPLGWASPGDRIPANLMDVNARAAARRERAQEWAGVTAQGSATIGGQDTNFSDALDPDLARAQASQEQARVDRLAQPLTPVETDQSGFGAAAQLGARATVGTVRGGMAVMASPLQAEVGNFRNLVAAFHPPDDAEVSPNPLAAAAASAFPAISIPAGMLGFDVGDGGFSGGQTQTGQIVRQAATDIQAGQAPNIDTGSGFFVDPDSRIERRRHRAELRRGTIAGSAITPGRVVAYEVVEPGTRPYNVISGVVDAAVAMWADPTNALLGGTSAARAAERELASGPAQGAGLINATRRTIDVDQVRNWLDSPGFREGFGRYAADGDYRAIREATRGRLPAEVEVALADASSTDEVAEILMPHVDDAGRPTGIGYDVRHPQDTLRLPNGLAMRRATSRVRAFNMMPSDTWRLDDASAMVEDTERFLRNIKATDDEVAGWAERMARTEPGIRGRNQRFGVLRDMMGDTAEGVLVNRFGIDEDVARDLTRMFDDAMEDHRVFALDAAGNHVLPAWADPAIAGADAEDLLDAIGPLLLTQHSNGLVPMADTRALRRLTSPEWEQRFTLARHMRNRAAAVQGTEVPLNMPIAGMMALQDRVWKPLQLIRAAWVTRVVGEEQFRIVADGLEGFNHPASWITWITGRKADALGNPFDEAEQFADGMASGSMGFRDLDAGRVRTVGSPRTFARDATGRGARGQYDRWWANEVARRANDPITQRVANNLDDLQAVKDWFYYPGHNELFDVMADAHPALLQRQVADAYIDQLADDVRYLAGGDPASGIPANERVLATIRDGHWTGDDGTRVALNHPDEARVSNDFINALRSQRDTGPVRVAGRDVIPDEARGRVVDFMFGALGATPTNVLSRSPGFRQFYWRRMEEMMPLLTPEAQEAAIEGATRAGLGRQQIRRLREFASRGTGESGLLEADDLAKWHALDDTRDLLYDLSERSQFFDIHRLLFPFGEAWQEVLTRWASLLRRNPRMIRRAQQGITEARNQGIFFTDENGEESFAYPASRVMLNAVGINSPTRLLGATSGLNMAGQLMPGVGPWVQMSAAALGDRVPLSVRDAVLPYGDQNATVFRALAPPWIERLVQAGASEGDITIPTTFGNREIPGVLRDAIRYSARFFDDSAETQRTYNTTVNMVQAQLAASGDYGPDPASQRRLVRDAKDQASTLTFFRAISSFFAPSAPRPEYRAEVTDDQTAVIANLSSEFHELQDEGMSWDAAMQDMLDRYGQNIVYALTGKTVSTSIAAPVTREAGEWDADHPFARTRYPAVFGLFAPQDGEFDYTVYSGEFGADGTRASLTPEQFNTAAQAQLAQIQWEEAKRQAGPEEGRPEEMTQWLREVHDWLSERYEGWENEAGVPGSPTIEESIEQLVRASQDDQLAEASPGAMEGLRSYLSARNQAADLVEEGRSSGVLESSGFQSSQETAPIRDWLRSYAEWVIARNPEFQSMWDRVFSRELKDAVEESE